jgi:hypothetical protein
MHKDAVVFKAPAVSHAAKLSLVPSPAEMAHADDGMAMGQGPFSPKYFLAGVCPPLRGASSGVSIARWRAVSGL